MFISEIHRRFERLRRSHVRRRYQQTIINKHLEKIVLFRQPSLYIYVERFYIWKTRPNRFTSRGRRYTTHLTPFQQATKTKLMHTGVGEAFAFHASQADRAVGWRRLIVLSTLLVTAVARVCVRAATVIWRRRTSMLLLFQKLANSHTRMVHLRCVALLGRWTFHC